MLINFIENSIKQTIQLVYSMNMVIRLSKYEERLRNLFPSVKRFSCHHSK